MATHIVMPSGGQTTDESLIARWCKKIGDPVHRGDVLFVVETDKAALDVESFAEGVLLEILHPEGDMVSTGETVALIGTPGESSGGTVAAVPVEEIPKPSAPDPEANQRSSSPAAPAEVASDSTSGIPLASPKARHAMRELEIDPRNVARIFPGAILKHQHILDFLADSAIQDYEDRPASAMRKAIARNLTESMRTAPQYQICIDIDMTELVNLRREVNVRLPADAIRISFNDFLMFAASHMMHRYPLINSSYLDDRIRTHRHVDFGLAVGLDEGLVVPVVHGADQMSLMQIAATNEENIALARGGQSSGKAFSGGTITLSNLGSFGVRGFSAILRPPESTILAVGAILEMPVVRDGLVVIRSMMTLTATFDHRIIDGAYGAAFLKELRLYLENPHLLLLN